MRFNGVGKNIGRRLKQKIDDDCKKQRLYMKKYPAWYAEYLEDRREATLLPSIASLYDRAEEQIHAMDLTLYEQMEKAANAAHDMFTVESVFGQNAGLWWKMRR